MNKLKRKEKSNPIVKFFLNRIFLFLKKTCPVVLLMFLMAEKGLAQKEKNGHLNITVIDSATRKETPVRIRLTQDDKPVKNLPEAAIGVMYGHWDHADGYAYQPDSSFYINGSFEMDLPPGNYHLSISKGNEYLDQQHKLTVLSGKVIQKTYEMTRWINMAERGWYSGDNHIHVRRSPREDPLLMSWIQAEDIHAGVMLQMGDFWQTYYSQYDWGEKGVYQEKNYILTTGQEDPRTPEIGHALGMGAREGVRYKQDYYLYDKVFDRVHELGGITGYAHQAASFHGYRGLTLDGLRNKVDVLELLQFCVSDQPLITENYYHLLDLGIPLTAVAGSDFPWCGIDHDSGPSSRFAQIGNVRFYTYTGQPFSYNTWKEGLAAGHTFVSSGPIVEFSINGSLPGDHLNVPKGSLLTISAKALGHPSQVPLSRLEIVGHGEILAQVSVDDPDQSSSQLSIVLEVPSDHGIWIAARTFGKPKQVAHTTPIYVTVDKGSFHNPITAPKYLALSEQYLNELEDQLEEHSMDPQYQAWHYKAQLKKRIKETRDIIEILKEKFK
ncbi:MAG: CehA/McbA family metallohydrolase [Cyclobacteriaceae bacterium]